MGCENLKLFYPLSNIVLYVKGGNNIQVKILTTITGNQNHTSPFPKFCLFTAHMEPPSIPNETRSAWDFDFL